MNSRQRLTTAFDLAQADRPPILGGWLAAPSHIQTLTGCSDDDYWADPEQWTIRAEAALGTDGLIHLFVPVSRGEYRCVDGQVLQKRRAYSLEDVVAEIEAMPTPEELAAGFDEEAAYAEFAARYRAQQAACGDMLWCPNQWDIIPKALWYHEYGYENALMLVALYPEHERKLLARGAVQGRQRATLIARGIREGWYPKGILTGEDLCGQRGPLVSPEFLRREYFPLVEAVFEPLVAAGARLVWHCDGDYRPLIPDVLACGAAGLQGFQAECGMTLDWITNLRTRSGDPLLIFGPLSVTTTMPYGTADDVRSEVTRAMNLCRDRASLVIFTSNTLTPDVPLDNIHALWDAVHASRW